MSVWNIVFTAVVIAFMIWRVLPTKGVRNITTKELKNELNGRNKQYIDVRTPREYKTNSIMWFKNIPLERLQVQSSGLSKDKEVVLLCQGCFRIDYCFTSKE